MFKMCCGDCGECWWVGNPRTCKCPDEKPVWDASASLVMTPNPVFATRDWVGLTDDEVNQLYTQIQEQVDKHWVDGGTSMMFPTTLYKAIEAKLKEKNT